MFVGGPSVSMGLPWLDQTRQSLRQRCSRLFERPSQHRVRRDKMALPPLEAEFQSLGCFVRWVRTVVLQWVSGLVGTMPEASASSAAKAVT